MSKTIVEDDESIDLAWLIDNKKLKVTYRTIKWSAIQIALLYLMPWIGESYFGTSVVILIVLYTALYNAWIVYVRKSIRLKMIWLPYALYELMALLFYIFSDNSSLRLYTLLPFFGFFVYLIIRITKRLSHKSMIRKMSLGVACIITLLVMINIGARWHSRNQGAIESEKYELMQRRAFLIDKLLTTPQGVLNAMPSGIGEQFQGEYALYSCSMFQSALVNMSYAYPELRKENIHLADSLIKIVLSSELRRYDRLRWDEDPLESLDGNKSHMSYISHLAWMICGYKKIGGGDDYNELLDRLCATLARRMENAPALNLLTYPGESIYIPDMLVAIVALKQYADLNGGKYQDLVDKWLQHASTDWIDDDTGLLVSFLSNEGDQHSDLPVKGSYSALNCYYLSIVDEKIARQQYELLKKLFWKDGALDGLKEYYDRSCYLGIDIDAGPILMELSPSGTAFMVGCATYFNDDDTRKKVLLTAEKVGWSVMWNGKRHYLLANFALVGESIMLAMRTHWTMLFQT